MTTETNRIENKRNIGICVISLLISLGLSFGPASYSPTLRKLFPFKIGVDYFKYNFATTYLSYSNTGFSWEDRKYRDGELVGEVVGVINGRPQIIYSNTRKIYARIIREELLMELNNREFLEIVKSYDGPINFNSLRDYVFDRKKQISPSFLGKKEAKNIE